VVEAEEGLAIKAEEAAPATPGRQLEPIPSP
jgi:hypothetical protein